jgi:hypothetical protein
MSSSSKRRLSPSSAITDPRAFEVRVWRVVACCGALALIAIAFVCSTQLGLTWDEPLQLRYGNRILAWYRSGFHDASALTYATPLFQYGGLFEAPAQFVAWLLPFEDVATRHVLTSLTAALGVVATWKLAARVAGSRAGFIAALVLVLTPAWTGHGFFNSKDIPFGAAAAWSLYTTILLATGPRPVPWRSVIFTGVAIGAAIGVRAGGLFLLAYPAIALVGRSWIDRRSVPLAADGCENLPTADGGNLPKPSSSWRSLARAGACIAVCVGIAWSEMLIAWPWAQIDPLRRPFAAVWSASHFGWGGEMLFRGEIVNAQAVPPDYLPTWFAITLPETYLVAALCSLAIGVWWWIERRAFGLAKREPISQRDALKWLTLAMIAIAAFGPVLAARLLRPVLYDAQRHFLFILPPLAAVSGIAISTWLSALRVPMGARALAACLFVVACAMTVREMIVLHPYEYVYFNRLEGGLAGASSRFETDYWGASYHEGMAWVVKNVHPANGTRLRVSSCACFYEARHYIDDVAHAGSRFEVVKDEAAADIVLVGSSHGCSSPQGKVLHLVERDGVPLLEVVRRDRTRG